MTEKLRPLIAASVACTLVAVALICTPWEGNSVLSIHNLENAGLDSDVTGDLRHVDSTSPSKNASANDAKGELESAELSRRLLGATVRFEIPLFGHLGFGIVVATSRTGFDVITADHVVASEEHYAIISATENSHDKSVNITEHENHTYNVVKRDPNADLAYIRVTTTTPPIHYIPLVGSIDRQDAKNFRVWLANRVNSKFIMEKAVVVGRRIAKRSNDAEAVFYWELDRKIDHGMSGGAMIDEQGRLIGIASGNSQSNAYYSDESELKKFFLCAGLNMPIENK